MRAGRLIGKGRAVIGLATQGGCLVSARGGRHGEAGGKGVRWGVSGRNGDIEAIEAIHPQKRKTGRGVGTGQVAKGGGKGGKRGARASGEMAAMGVFGRSSAVAGCNERLWAVAPEKA